MKWFKFPQDHYRKLELSSQYTNALISNTIKTSWFAQRKTSLWVTIPNKAHANTTVTGGIYNLISPQETWKSNLHAYSLKWELCSIFHVPYFNNGPLILFYLLIFCGFITLHSFKEIQQRECFLLLSDVWFSKISFQHRLTECPRIFVRNQSQ